MEEVFKSLQGMTYISDPNASDSITNYTKKSAAASTDTAVPTAFTAANKRSLKGNGGSGGTMRYRGVRCRPWGRYLLRYETPSPRNGVGSGLLTPPRRLHAPTTSSLANQHSGDFSVGSSAQRNASPNMVLFRNLLNSSNSSLHAPPPQSLADYIPLIHGNASSSSFSFTFPANSSILPCASLLKSFTNNITRSATDSVSDSFTGTTMTHTPKETIDDMEFFRRSLQIPACSRK
ncbi:ethylene-responsive transcription factor ESR2-like [Hibiscus syriacus]|uniref:ethylene-responsive transcription factor ESR2-like n=1 Tax=Hibiscus syriacus TaxID=106335 RepID=UPI0019243B33|nr:ethylene-responsive transcription factor ESR2-like [Hibiscus syriacus]